MALIINEAKTESIYTYVPSSPNIGIRIPKEKLSEPYDLDSGAELKGSILAVFDLEKGVPVTGLENQDITLRLKKGSIGPNDYLLIEDKSWVLLRDYGILPNKSALSIRLTKIIQYEIPSYNTHENKTSELKLKEIEIYPKRDVAYG